MGFLPSIGHTLFRRCEEALTGGLAQQTPAQTEKAHQKGTPMANKNQKQEHKQDKQQPATTPATPVELSDEELQQVTGGFNPQPEPPGKPMPTGIEFF